MNIVNLAQMAKSQFDNLFGLFFGASSAIGFLDSSGNAILETVKIVEIQHKREKKIMEFATETGESVASHAVIPPREFSLNCIIPTEDIGELDRYFLTSELFSLTTTSDTYNNLTITSLPIGEGKDGMMGSVSVSITVKEVNFAEVTIAKGKASVKTKGKKAKRKSTGKKQLKAVSTTSATGGTALQGTVQGIQGAVQGIRDYFAG